MQQNGTPTYGTLTGTSLPIQTTLKLNKGDKIEVRLTGTMTEINNASRTFFEGRLISKIDE